MAFDKFTDFANTVRINWVLTALLLIGLTASGQAQTRKYLVLLRDKAGTPYSVDRPEQFLSQRAILRRQRQNIPVQLRDLPVNPAYISQLQQAGAKIWFPSRWFNAVLIEANDAVLATVRQLPFVSGIEFDRPLSGARQRADAYSPDRKFGTIAALDYGPSQTQVTQIGADKMHDAGYHGEGMLIGVLDGGFLNADKVGFLKPLFDEQRVLATYDFVAKETSVYEDDSHGMSCLAAIAATSSGLLYGTAYKASFILLRTEDVASESRVEEANWLFGAEYADSAGVDVISSSLGYTQFDDASSNYTYANMDGKTAICTRAAQIATQTGMVVVVAAGNEGDNAWRYISAPSDAASVLAVGAVTSAGNRASFSSIGPSADGRVKPDLDARGQGTVIGAPDGRVVSGNGTSFATPLLAGLAAGFWQANPRLTAAQVTAALRRSGSQYTTPDAQLGYGIPDFSRAQTVVETFKPLTVYPIPFSDLEPLMVSWGELDVNTVLEATLTDLAGRLLWQTRTTPPGVAAFTLPNIGLSTGMYVLTLVAGENKRSLKVLKR
ncbi:putative secreted protein (Por secretion system target) [Spirosoma oryzae]|uniref:Putative secreted protein (Por secretion system target) n=1 Tax=Spirosoma oryzae TaxID=1469603 RepID=A0A2T0TNU7_9BACT|nr:S8 family serine peptidase [Spirosoma oryzae]PRY47323.1 putative secreted protein (Por secretion system target) [Spirosoma oryzae]